MKWLHYLFIVSLLLFSCKGQNVKNKRPTRLLTDALQREVALPDTIRQLVCIRSSAIRLVTYAGGAPLICGVEEQETRPNEFTHIFAYPDLARLPIIGPGMGGDPELIMAAGPDVIFMTYVADKNIAFQIVTDENIATATDLSTLSDPQFRAAMLEAGFPSSYIGALAQLHQAYPKWSFSPYITGLDWNTVISKESKVGLNLISNAKSAEWKSKAAGAYNATTGKYIPFDGSTWVTASEAAVRYYMDPRNFLDGRGIFQFESLAYNKISHTQSGVESILKNTPMYNKTFSYPDDVTNTTKSMKYSQAFMAAADTSGVSPYHLASRVKQEVVISPTTMSDSVSGTRSGYTGIYNFYNIGATNTTSGSAVNNGLKWASTGTSYLRPWNSRYRSIVGGAIYIGEKYINVGQNTSYLQKFNVTEKNRYNHQYMSNIEAPNSEATKTASAYSATLNEMTLVFSIPVYTNMPEEVSPIPTK